MRNKLPRIIVGLSFGVLSIFFGIVFFSWTIVPFIQMKHYFHALRSLKRGGGEAIKSEVIYSPHTYVQPKIRSDLVEVLIAGYNQNTNPDLLSFALKKYEEEQPFVKDDARYYLTVARAYSLLAKTTGEKQFADTAIENYEETLALWPHSVPAVFEYSVSLVNMGKNKEAIDLVQAALARNPAITAFHYYLGYALFRSGPSSYNAALEQFEKMFPASEDVDLETTKDIYSTFFKYYYRQGDREHFVRVLERLQELDPNNVKIYNSIEQYIQAKQRLPVINIK